MSLEDLLEVTLVSDRARIFGQLPWAAVSSRHHCHPDQGKSISDQARGREVPSIRSPMAPACTDVSDPSRGMSARGVRVSLLHTSLRRGGRQRCIVQTGFCHERAEPNVINSRDEQAWPIRVRPCLGAYGNVLSIGPAVPPQGRPLVI